MRTILKWKWLVLALWLAAAAGLILSAPNMEQLVRDKGQIEVPKGYPSSTAAKLLTEMNGTGSEQDGKDAEKAAASTVLVFHSDKALTDADLKEIRRGVDILKKDKTKYGIESVTTHLDNEALAGQMVSKDNKTVLVLLSVSREGREDAEAADSLYAALSDVKVAHYYTGNWLISEDVVQSSQQGLKKTEGITVVFILAILFLVFRSAVAPFIPLLTVGLSYAVSQAVVAFLVKYMDFPLSTFTQIFMVAVLFGIGTDYCILLISRFKEELAHRDSKSEAIFATYRTAGRTVLISGLAVLVGFSTIGFSTFALYRSAVAVAVGVAVLLIALVTLVPFFMAVLGRATFWPARGSLEHKPSRLWGAAGTFALRRPLVALLVIAAVTVPFLGVYKGSISFNSLDEIGDRYNSVKAFNVIADSFGPGDSLPSTVVLKTAKPLDTKEGLAAVEQITRELAKIDGVKTVRSATRPAGDPLQDLQVVDQASKLGNGIGEAGSGIGQISGGLSDASSALSANKPKLDEAVSGADRLIAGTDSLKAGIAELGTGLTRIQQGLESGSAGAGELKDGLSQAKASADKLAAANRELLSAYKTVGGGLSKLSKAYADIAAQQDGIASGMADLGRSLSGLADKYPELQSDADFRKAQAAVTGLQTGAGRVSAGLKQLNAQLAGASAGVGKANAGLQQAADGQAALAQGLAKLSAGIASLQQGIDQAATGQGRIVDGLPGVTGGIDSLAAGQKQLRDGIAQLGGQLTQLTGGLDKSVGGLSQVSTGLKSAQSYLDDLAAAPDGQLAGWYLPDEAITNPDFQTALDVYMSKDRRIAKFDVVFAGNPYELATLNKVDDLEDAAKRGLKDTAYAAGTQTAIGGVSSMNNDLRNISASDYSRTVALMLTGIGLILIILFRSIVMPVYLLLSLLLTYYTSTAIAEVIFVRILGLSGISWAVPFFGFVMLMALGIDYSIFLMDRFREYRHLPPREGILLAMRNMGTVIMSAALILGGTFAAMLPSGVMSLLQIATIVLCGLFLYALVVIPLLIPVMVRTFGEANWWPFMKRPASEAETDGHGPTGRPDTTVSH